MIKIPRQYVYDCLGMILSSLNLASLDLPIDCYAVESHRNKRHVGSYRRFHGVYPQELE